MPRPSEPDPTPPAATPADFAVLASRGQWTPAPHLLLLNYFLLEMAAGACPRLLVTMPPRHGKSMLTSQYFPAWYLGTYPEDRVILASYEADFAAEWGRKVQDLIQEWGPSVFGVSVDPATTAASRWNLKGHLGGMKTAGVGGPLTGSGANCLSGETLITTRIGEIPVSSLVRSRSLPKVLAFDHRTGRPCWRPVVATRESTVDELYEVETVGGRRIRATGEHRFYVQGRGYRPASLLAPGDRLAVPSQESIQQDMRPVRPAQGRPGGGLPGLLRPDPQDDPDPDVCPVQRGLPEAAVRLREGVAEAGRGGLLLLRGLFRGRPRGQERPEVPAVLQADARGEVAPLLFGRVPAGGPVRGQGAQGDRLSGVRGAVPAEVGEGDLLRAGLRRQGPFDEDGRGGQLAFQGREELRPLVPSDAPADPRSGRVRLRGLPAWGGLPGLAMGPEGDLQIEPGGPSRQRGSDRQPARESGHALLDVPRDPPQVAFDAVAVVRRVRSPGHRVYDLQVEGLRNFVAGEVLVHNCLIIDDPIKNHEEASSEVRREALWDWYRSTARTRLEPGGRVLLIQTRWHTDDLAGRILASAESSGEPWVVLKIPALSDGPDVYAEVTRYNSAA